MVHETTVVNRTILVMLLSCENCSQDRERRKGDVTVDKGNGRTGKFRGKGMWEEQENREYTNNIGMMAVAVLRGGQRELGTSPVITVD